MSRVYYDKCKEGIRVPEHAVIIPVATKRRKAHIVLFGVEHKHCRHCDTWIPIDFFSPDKTFWDGLHSFCCHCTNEIGSNRGVGSKR